MAIVITVSYDNDCIDLNFEQKFLMKKCMALNRILDTTRYKRNNRTGIKNKKCKIKCEEKNIVPKFLSLKMKFCIKYLNVKYMNTNFSEI